MRLGNKPHGVLKTCCAHNHKGIVALSTYEVHNDVHKNLQIRQVVSYIRFQASGDKRKHSTSESHNLL